MRHCVLYSSGSAVWSVEGVETVSALLVEEGDLDHYVMTCESFHLTSFAVLVDVYGNTDVMNYMLACREFWY